ncbi:MAG: hypothetical protein ACUVX8_10465 [Candidatus Zipacnadales bacterium]
MTILMLLGMAIIEQVGAAPLVCGFERENEVEGWTAAGPSATTKITKEPDQVREGQSALLCTYTGVAGAPFSLTRTGLAVGEATALLVSLKASSQSPFVFSVAEKDGSIYHTFVTCPAGEWCDISLPLSDFQLQEGSQDENDALDIDQVRTFVMQELSNMPGALGEIFGIKLGEQALVVDAVGFVAQKVSSRSKVTPDKVEVDGFDRPWFQALPVGTARLRHLSGRTDDEPSALSIRFTFQPAGAQQWSGVVLPVGHVDLTTARTLRVRVKSRGPLNMHVLLEEQDGSRYEARRTLPEADEWQARDFPLADFSLEPDRADENGVLDPGQLRVVVIVVDAWNALLDENEEGEFALDEVLFITG